MIIEPIEYIEDKDRYYLTIGSNAPWDNFHIRIPYLLFVIVLKIKTRFMRGKWKKAIQ